jgi:hypothetical protein
MARSSTQKLLLIGGVGLGAAYMGWLGSDAQRKIREIFRGGQTALGPSSPLYPGGSGGGQTGGFGGNPYFWQQAAEWKAQSGSRDWNAFRTHVMAIGAPDPGPSAPAGW